MSELMPSPGFVRGPASRRDRAPILFLDRDGVINVNHGYVHTADRTEWVPGIFRLLERATVQGYQVVIATNQAGIARGYYGVEQFTAYTNWQQARLAEVGAELLGTFFCPHHPSVGQGRFQCNCQCRKPRPGMFLEALRQFDIDPSAAILVGDKISDMQAGSAADIGRLVLLGEDVGTGEMPGATWRAGTLDDVSGRNELFAAIR